MSASSRELHQVRIVDGAPGKSRIQGRTAVVVRGQLNPEFFNTLWVPEYQRVAMEGVKHDELKHALGPDGTGVPDDLLLCTRSNSWKALGAGELLITTPGLIVLDGHQRYFAAKTRLGCSQTTDPFGVKIFLGTTEDEEIRTFYQVNRLQTKVSTQVLLRNSGTNAAIEALRKMTVAAKGFPQVQWDQLRKPGDVITAHMLYEVAIVLHGYAQKGPIEKILQALEEISDKIGTERLVDNTKTFFEVVRRCFGSGNLNRFMYRLDVLRGLAMLFAQHEDFWDKKNSSKLFVRAPFIKKLSGIRTRVVERDLETTNASASLAHSFRHRIESGRAPGSPGLTTRES